MCVVPEIGVVHIVITEISLTTMAGRVACFFSSSACRFAFLVFVLVVSAVGADDECVGGVCPVPSHFAGAGPPDAPEFEVRDVASDDSARGTKAAAADQPESAKDAKADVTSPDSPTGPSGEAAPVEDSADEEDEELSLGVETETMSMDEFKSMQKESAEGAGAQAAKEPAADPAAADPAAADPAAADPAAADPAAADPAAADPAEVAPAAEAAVTADNAAAEADAGAPYGDSATTEDGAVATKSKLGQSKLAQSKMAGAAASAETKSTTPVPRADKGEGAAGAAEASAPSDGAEGGATKVETAGETPFDLMTEISLMRVMAQMGATSTMMDLLYNVTFHLADVDADGKLSAAEGRAFAEEHLQEKSPLAQVLGLSGGHLPLHEPAAIDRAIDTLQKQCDADADGLVDREEATRCSDYVYGLLYEANRKRLESAQQQQQAQAPSGGTPAPSAAAGRSGAAAAGAAAASGGASGGQAPNLNEWFQSMAGGAGGAGGMAKRSKPNPVQAEFDRRLQMVQRVLLEHWNNPNMNTLIGTIGIAAMMLRELLAADLFQLRHKLRGLVGSNVPEFNTRLLHVGLVSLVVAAVAKLE